MCLSDINYHPQIHVSFSCHGLSMEVMNKIWVNCPNCGGILKAEVGSHEGPCVFCDEVIRVSASVELVKKDDEQAMRLAGRISDWKTGVTRNTPDEVRCPSCGGAGSPSEPDATRHVLKGGRLMRGSSLP